MTGTCMRLVGIDHPENLGTAELLELQCLHVNA